MHVAIRTIVFALLAASASAVLAGPDDAALRSYMLTMPRLQKLHQVEVALAHTTDPAVRSEMPAIDGLLNGSIAEAEAKLRRAPHVEAVIRQNGSTDHDFAMTMATLIGASMAGAASPAALARMPVAPANVAFIRQHQAELAPLHLLGD